MIVTLFPEPGEQARAIAVFSFVAAAGASIGLLAGGVLTQALDWHWIFFVNVPIGAAAWFFAARLLDAEAGAGWRAGADVPGAVLVTAALMLGVYTIVDAHSVAARRCCPSRCWRRSSSARRRPRGRCCRSACCARATWSARTRSNS